MTRRGFTLIELLVVIAIISILASILMPVFARAREKARTTSCMSNQRQITLALLSYAQDADEFLPRFSHGGGHMGSFGYGGDDGMRWADMVFPYVRNTQVFDCTSGTTKLKIYSGGNWFDIGTYSYGYVSASSGAEDFGVGGRGLGVFPDPAGTIILCDDGRNEDAGDSECLGRVIPTAGDSIETLATRVNGMRHTGASHSDVGEHALNAAYVDGHAKFVRLTQTFPKQWTLAQED